MTFGGNTHDLKWDRNPPENEPDIPCSKYEKTYYAKPGLGSNSTVGEHWLIDYLKPYATSTAKVIYGRWFKIINQYPKRL